MQNSKANAKQPEAMKYFLYAIVGRKHGKRRYDLLHNLPSGSSAIFGKVEHAEDFLQAVTEKHPDYEFRIAPATAEIDLAGIQV